jgi:hypothetical protein
MPEDLLFSTENAHVSQLFFISLAIGKKMLNVIQSCGVPARKRLF